MEKKLISVCCGTGCRASGALEVVEALEKGTITLGLNLVVSTKLTGCHGFCEKGPLLVIYPEKILYCKVTADDVDEILKETIIKGRLVERLLYVEPFTGDRIANEEDIPFYKKQRRLVLGNNGKIDPTDIKDYIDLGGYGALKKALQKMSCQEIIDEIKASGLRGRGGGGFPTWKKWDICRNTRADTKYIICNADEGDPGCFQDRSVLEGNPHSVLEGMVIGGLTVGASAGYVYVRNEYPLAIKHLEIAIKQAREHGFLGNNILNSDFSFNIKLCKGGGAFVCGEETALISSIEAVTGEPNPRPRPPYPAEKGLWGKPTVINNVKTWATVPLIIERGSQWYSSIGQDNSKGTMIFSLTGKVRNTGLIEVPMGLSLRELVFGIGGGIPEDKAFKAVQTGGPAGGCIPEKLLDMPLDYEKLQEAGSIMGSGGMIVMDEGTCMVDVARYFLSFTQDESCGKCTPCREGGKQMLTILENITKGHGTMKDLDLLEEIAQVMRNGSLCGLGKMAANPVITTLNYFHDEYAAHIRDKKCPAKICRELIQYSVIAENCTGCGKCKKNCPTDAISGEPKGIHVINNKKCTRCGACLDTCSFAAINVE